MAKRDVAMTRVAVGTGIVIVSAMSLAGCGSSPPSRSPAPTAPGSRAPTRITPTPAPSGIDRERAIAIARAAVPRYADEDVLSADVLRYVDAVTEYTAAHFTPAPAPDHLVWRVSLGTLCGPLCGSGTDGDHRLLGRAIPPGDRLGELTLLRVSTPTRRRSEWDRAHQAVSRPGLRDGPRRTAARSPPSGRHQPHGGLRHRQSSGPPGLDLQRAVSALRTRVGTTSAGPRTATQSHRPPSAGCHSPTAVRCPRWLSHR